MRFPGGSAGKESACNVEELRMNPWRRKLPTPVFWPGEFLGLYSPWARKKSEMTELISLHKVLCINVYFH